MEANGRPKGARLFGSGTRGPTRPKRGTRSGRPGGGCRRRLPSGPPATPAIGPGSPCPRFLAQGEPGRLVGLIGPDTDLAGAIEQRGVFVVHLLADRADHRRLAQHFAGSLGAAGDLLEVEEDPYGPRLLAAPDQLDCRVTDRRATGWSDLVEADVDDIRLGPPRPGLLWYGGEFRRWA